MIEIPATAKVCGIRYYQGEESSQMPEVTSMRNTVRGNTHRSDFMRTGKAKTTTKKGLLTVRVEFKNWNRSESRYFKFEVDYQPHQ